MRLPCGYERLTTVCATRPAQSGLISRPIAPHLSRFAGTDFGTASEQRTNEMNRAGTRANLEAELQEAGAHHMHRAAWRQAQGRVMLLDGAVHAFQETGRSGNDAMRKKLWSVFGQKKKSAVSSFLLLFGVGSQRHAFVPEPWNVACPLRLRRRVTSSRCC
jgi:hypothetical protein